jgi:hypothetical protein
MADVVGAAQNPALAQGPDAMAPDNAWMVRWSDRERR